MQNKALKKIEKTIHAKNHEFIVLFICPNITKISPLMKKIRSLRKIIA